MQDVSLMGHFQWLLILICVGNSKNLVMFFGYSGHTEDAYRQALTFSWHS